MASTDRIHFNLDTAERPDHFEVFVANIAGKAVPISDPADLDYKVLLAVDSPFEFFRHCMSQEDRDLLAAQDMPGWRLGLLLEAYLKHYKAEERIDERKRLGF